LQHITELYQNEHVRNPALSFYEITQLLMKKPLNSSVSVTYSVTDGFYVLNSFHDKVALLDIFRNFSFVL